jgi:hypothetical protein
VTSGRRYEVVLLFLGLAVVGAGAACRPAEGDGEDEPMVLRLTVASDKGSYDADEPIRLTITLANEGDSPVTANGRFLVNYPTAPEPVRDLYFEVSGPEGYANQRVFRVNAGFPRTTDLVTLEPGESHQKVVELTRYHSLHLPGTYEVTAHYQSAAPIAGQEVWLGQLESEPLVLERGG